MEAIEGIQVVDRDLAERERRLTEVTQGEQINYRKMMRGREGFDLLVRGKLGRRDGAENERRGSAGISRSNGDIGDVGECQTHVAGAGDHGHRLLDIADDAGRE